MTAWTKTWIGAMGMSMLTSFGDTTKAQHGNWVHLGPTGVRVESIAFDPHDPEVICVGATPDGLYRSQDGGDNWALIGFERVRGWISSIMAHPRDSKNILLSMTSKPAGVHSIYRSDDGGQTWRPSDAGIDSFRTEPPQAYTPVYVLRSESTEPSVIYAGAGLGVYRSLDHGRTWMKIGIPDSVTRYDVTISEILIDPRDPDRMYAGGDGNGVIGLLFLSEDAGHTWRLLRDFCCDGNVTEMVFNPHNPNTIYAIVPGLRVSYDAGHSWKGPPFPYSGGIPIRIAISAVDTNLIYVGTKGGVFRSRDAGQIWEAINEDLTDPWIRSLAISPHDSVTLYAGTISNGIYKLVETPTSVAVDHTTRSAHDFRLLASYPNPFHPGARHRGVATIQFELAVETDVDICIYNLAGQRVRQLRSGRMGAGSHAVQWDGRDIRGKPAPAAVYFYTLSAGDFRHSRKMVLVQ